MNIYKKIVCIFLTTMLLLTSCTSGELEKYNFSFFGTFDTITQVILYTKSESEAKETQEFIESRFMELHKYFDKYNDYEGINNVKTINDNAGKEPVKVSQEIINLIKFSIEGYNNISDETNIAMGSVLKIWSSYRDNHELGSDIDSEGAANSSGSSNAELPPMEELQEANMHTDIENIVIDEENSTVYLSDPMMSIDVGAVAKGFATEIIADEIIERGIESALISSGGNVKVIGSPPESDRGKFSIGLQHPDVLFDNGTGDNLIDVVFINNKSVVTSGDYQRFYIVDGKRYHHLIDSDTLMPGEYFRAVSVVTENSGLADFLSTSLFLMPYEEGLKLIEGMEDVEAYWVLLDGSVKFTPGMEEILSSQGATDE